MKRVVAFLFVAILAFGANELSGRRAPGFSLPDSNFKRYDLQDYRGKWVLIDFMVTHCPHCQVLSKTLEQVKEKYGDRVAILSVVLPPDRTDDVAAYIKDNNVTVPVLFDQGQMAASYFEATPQNPRFDSPHLFVIDPKGMIVRDYGRGEGDADTYVLEGPGLMNVLKSVISDKK
jgi:peroxiredoxin